MAVAPKVEAALEAELGQPATHRSRGLRVLAPLLAVYAVWGSTYFGIRVTIGSIPPFLQGGVRFLLAGGILYAWSALRAAPGERWPSLRSWIAASITGGALLTLGNGGVSWAEQYVPTGTASLMIATVPLWIATLAWLTWRRSLHWVSMAGIVLGFAGMALLVAPSFANFGSNAVGLIVLLLSAVSWAAGSIYARTAATPASPAMGTAMQMLVGGALLLAFSFVSGEAFRVHLDKVTWSSAEALAYLIVFGSLVAYTCYAWLLRNADLTLVSTYAYVNPVVAVMLGTLFLGEQLSARVVFAAAVILVGVAAIVSRQRASA